MAQTRGFQIQAQPVYTPADPRLLAFNPALIGQGIGQGLQLADQYATQKENRALAPFRQAAAQTNAELAAIQLAEAQKNMSEIPLGIALKEIPRGDFPVPADLPEGTVGNPNVPAGTPSDIVEVERVQVGNRVIERPRRIIQTAEQRASQQPLLTLDEAGLRNLAPGTTYDVLGRTPEGQLQIGNIQGRVLGEASRGQQGGTFQLADGSIVKSVFDPTRNAYFYTDQSGQNVPIPAGAKPVTLSSQAMEKMRVTDLNKLQVANQAEERSLRSLQSYMKSTEGTRQGVAGLVDKLAGAVQTAVGVEKLSDEQLAQFVNEGQLQGLIGEVRTDVLGPGVLTNQDAQRLMSFLGGEPGLLRNKQAVRDAINRILAEKYERYLVGVEQYNEQVKSFYNSRTPITPVEIDTASLEQGPFTVSPNQTRRLNTSPVTGAAPATDENAQRNAQQNSQSTADSIFQEIMNRRRK